MPASYCLLGFQSSSPSDISDNGRIPPDGSVHEPFDTVLAETVRNITTPGRRYSAPTARKVNISHVKSLDRHSRKKQFPRYPVWAFFVLLRIGKNQGLRAWRPARRRRDWGFRCRHRDLRGRLPTALSINGNEDRYLMSETATFRTQPPRTFLAGR